MCRLSLIRVFDLAEVAFYFQDKLAKLPGCDLNPECAVQFRLLGHFPVPGLPAESMWTDLGPSTGRTWP